VDGDGEDRGDGRGGEGGNEGCIGDKRLCARHLARVGQLRRIEKAPLNRARRSMDRTDSDRAGLPVGLELSGDGGKELRAQALIDRLRQREEQIFFFVVQGEHGEQLRVGRSPR
jgi:hypothetical protein